MYGASLDSSRHWSRQSCQRDNETGRPIRDGPFFYAWRFRPPPETTCSA